MVLQKGDKWVLCWQNHRIDRPHMQDSSDRIIWTGQVHFGFEENLGICVGGGGTPYWMKSIWRLMPCTVSMSEFMNRKAFPSEPNSKASGFSILHYIDITCIRRKREGVNCS